MTTSFIIHDLGWQPIRGERNCDTARLRIGQSDPKPLRDGSRRFGKLTKRKTFRAPTIESTFEDPNVLHAYSLQCHRCPRAHDVAPRRTIENDLDIVGHGN